MSGLGELIKSKRTELGLSQEYFARLVGVSRFAVIAWENGQRKPHLANCREIARIFGVETKEITKYL